MPTLCAPLAVLALVTLTALTACTPVPPGHIAQPTSAPSATPIIASTQSPTPTPTEAAAQRPTADTISCDTMLRPGVLDRIRGEGLISAPKTDYMFGIVVNGAHLSCPWGNEGDMDATYLYSWTTLTSAERDAVLVAAGDNGYRSEPGDGGSWLTRDYQGYPEPGFFVGRDYVVVTPSRATVADIVWAD
ncbi:hypothetical protein MMX123_02020 [Microbacterium sp. MM2322]|uniref:hypothetical protein n=1 Tax=Microbacterium sp. MM2322 TaxID=3157631 RepID=UPI003D804027